MGYIFIKMHEYYNIYFKILTIMYKHLQNMVKEWNQYKIIEHENRLRLFSGFK